MRKLNWVYSIKWAFMVLILWGCTEKIEGPQKFKLIMPDESGVWAMQVVEIKTLVNIEQMKGAAAELFISIPSQKENMIQYRVPKTHFVKDSEGVWIPKDSDSHQLAVLYAHLERLMEFDQAVGTYSHVDYPRRALIQVPKSSFRDKSHNNAYYSGQSDSYYFLEFSGMELLPFTLNPQIIGHEHGHALFVDRLWLADSKSQCKKTVSSIHEDLLKMAKNAQLSAPESLASESTEGDGVQSFENRSMELDELLVKERLIYSRSDFSTQTFNIIMDEKLYNLSLEEDEVKDFISKREELMEDCQTAIYRNAMSEGLADLWGFLYSGHEKHFEVSANQNSSLMRRVLGSTKARLDSRERRYELDQFDSRKFMRGFLRKVTDNNIGIAQLQNLKNVVAEGYMESIVDFSYSYATVFSQFFYEALNIYVQQMRNVPEIKKLEDGQLANWSYNERVEAAKFLRQILTTIRADMIVSSSESRQRSSITKLLLLTVEESKREPYCEMVKTFSLLEADERDLCDKNNQPLVNAEKKSIIENDSSLTGK